MSFEVRKGEILASVVSLAQVKTEIVEAIGLRPITDGEVTLNETISPQKWKAMYQAQNSHLLLKIEKNLA